MNMKQLCAKEALKYIKDGRGEKNNGSNSI